VNHGSSWIGFFARADRGRAWLDYAQSCLATHNGYVGVANIAKTEESEKMLRDLKRKCAWALARAERYGADWRDRNYVPQARYHLEVGHGLEKL
jgi:hypothetical protein